MLPIRDSKMNIIGATADPVGIWGLGQGWARNAPTYTHIGGHVNRLRRYTRA